MDRNQFLEFKTLTTKDQKVSFKEEKLLALVPVGNTFDDLSILSFKDKAPPGDTSKSSYKGQTSVVSQQMIELGYPILNCEGADEDLLDGSKIDLVLIYEGKDAVSNPVYIPYNIVFKREGSKFDWRLLAIFIVVVLLMLLLLMNTCNNLRLVNNNREEYAATFRKYTIETKELNSNRKLRA